MSERSDEEPATGEPRISVVVPTRNRPDMLDECLAALRGSLRDTDELLVVDSASSVAEVKDVALAHGATYLRSDVKGASLARNIGWRQAQHDVIGFIDDDVRVTPQWADAMRKAFVSCDVVFVTGRVLERPGPLGYSMRPVATIDLAEPVVFRRDDWQTPGHGANVAVRRHALIKVAGYDERLGAGGEFKAAEDVDLFDRLLAEGWPGNYDPDVLVYHEQWRRRSELAALDFSYGFGGGARIAKLIRSDPYRSLRKAKALYWGWGLAEIGIFLWRRIPWMSGLAAIRFFGAVAGFLRAIGVPVKNGHFARRRKR